MQLYYIPGACSLADHIALEWVGANYDMVEMNFKSIKSPDYMAMNPGGNVPLLKHGDFLLTENVAILHYLAETFPKAQLLGKDTPRDRAEVMRWLAFINSDVHPSFHPLFMHHRSADPAAERVVAGAARQVRRYLERLERQLEGKSWVVGERSVVDPYLFVVLRWATVLKLDLDGLNNLAAFSDRMYSDDGVSAALFAEEGLQI